VRWPDRIDALEELGHALASGHTSASDFEDAKRRVLFEADSARSSLAISLRPTKTAIYGIVVLALVFVTAVVLLSRGEDRGADPIKRTASVGAARGDTSDSRLDNNRRRKVRDALGRCTLTDNSVGGARAYTQCLKSKSITGEEIRWYNDRFGGADDAVQARIVLQADTLQYCSSMKHDARLYGNCLTMSRRWNGW
jgi:hypothetical protein